MTFPSSGSQVRTFVRRSERSPGFARLRSRGFFLRVHRLEMMQRVMQFALLNFNTSAHLAPSPRATHAKA